MSVCISVLANTFFSEADEVTGDNGGVDPFVDTSPPPLEADEDFADEDTSLLSAWKCSREVELVVNDAAAAAFVDNLEYFIILYY